MKLKAGTLAHDGCPNKVTPTSQLSQDLLEARIFFLRVPTEDLFHMKPVNDNEKEVEDEGRRRRKMEKRGFFP